MSKGLNIKLVSEAWHRNGICGTGFDVALFDATIDSGPQRMVAILRSPEDENVGVDCFVLDVAKLAAGDIAFGSNSWRGDDFAPDLRAQIEDRRAQTERTWADDPRHWAGPTTE